MNVGYEVSDHFVFNLQHVIITWVGKMLSCMVRKDQAEMACKRDRIGGKRKPFRTLLVLVDKAVIVTVS
jgi:hypothetical protein